MPHTRLIRGAILLGAFACVACDSRPTTPSSPATPIAPTATPTPTPTATPNPDVPPSDSGCGKPYPPPISRLGVKVHFKQRDYWNVDSTPLVGPNPGYCGMIGFTDGRSLCPVRPEGAPDRVACENWRVGLAKDTGKPGPTWIRIDAAGHESYCLKRWSGVNDCEHEPENPYQLRAIARGTYQACTETGVCGSAYVDRGP
jgi:hypothetical protein